MTCTPAPDGYGCWVYDPCCGTCSCYCYPCDCGQPFMGVRQLRNGVGLIVDPHQMRRAIRYRRQEQAAQNRSAVRNRKRFLSMPRVVMIEDRQSTGARQKVSGSRVVITAADDAYFIGFQLLWASILVHQDVDIVFFDLGVQSHQKAWLEKNNVIVVDASDLPKVQTHKSNWSIANKPLYFEKAKDMGWQTVLWIDSDCMVRGNLNELFCRIEAGPYISCDSGTVDGQKFQKEALMNAEVLYRIMPTPVRWEEAPFLNAGVVGLDVKRDVQILKDWSHCLQKTNESTLLKKSVSLGDQGALVWSLEKNECLGCHVGWNQRTAIESKDAQIFWNMASTSTSNISHFVGVKKPWDYWGASRVEFATWFEDFDFYIGESKRFHKSIPVYRSANPFLSASPESDFVGVFGTATSSDFYVFNKQRDVIQTLELHPAACLNQKCLREVCKLFDVETLDGPIVKDRFVCEKQVFLDLSKSMRSVIAYFDNIEGKLPWSDRELIETVVAVYFATHYPQPVVHAQT